MLTYKQLMEGLASSFDKQQYLFSLEITSSCSFPLSKNFWNYFLGILDELDHSRRNQQSTKKQQQQQHNTCSKQMTPVLYNFWYW